MSVLTNAVSDAISRTANLPAANAFTALGWTYVVSNPSATVIQPLMWLGNASGANGHLFAYEEGGAGNFMEVFKIVGGTAEAGTMLASQPSTGVWFHWYLSSGAFGAGNLNAGWAGVTDNSYVSATVESGDPGTVGLLAFGPLLSTYGLNARWAGLKVWGAQLTESEALIEKQYYRAARRANLLFEWPLLDSSDSRDLSGNGWGPTLTSVDSADGPPIKWSPFGPPTFPPAPAAPGGSALPKIMQQLTDAGQLAPKDLAIATTLAASTKVKNRREMLAVLGAYGLLLTGK